MSIRIPNGGLTLPNNHTGIGDLKLLALPSASNRVKAVRLLNAVEPSCQSRLYVDSKTDMDGEKLAFGVGSE